MDNYIESYNEQGFCIIKNLLSQELLNKCNNYIDNYENSEKIDMVQYTNLPSIFKNIDEEGSPFLDILKNNKIIEFANKLNITNIDSLYPRCYNKPRWYGNAAEYHQEIFFNYKYGYDICENDLFQIFIALESHTENNACMRIIPQTHKMGLLKTNNCFKNNFISNYRIDVDVLDECYKKYGIHNCILDKGDCIIFHPLVVHGSSSNSSPHNRRVYTTGIINKEKIDNYNPNNETNKNFINERKKFLIEEFSKFLLNF